MIDCARAIEVDDNTACAAYQWLREVCSTKLLGLDIKLGGQGQVVQIDESLFRHKSKVKYNIVPLCSVSLRLKFPF